MAANASTYTHSIALQVTLGDINGIASAAQLLLSLKTGIQASSGGNVTVSITSIQVSSSYSGMPAGFATNTAITAYAHMTNVSTSMVTVNGASYGGRRLSTTADVVVSTTADVVATVLNTGSEDIVTATKSVIGSTSVSAFASALVTTDPTNYANVTSSLTQTSAPAATVQVSATVTGSTVATVDAAALEASVINNVPGGATVTANVTTTSDATTTTTAPAGDFSHAPIVAPMMSIWVVVYAFIMS
jgi:hypothetical protein